MNLEDRHSLVSALGMDLRNGYLDNFFVFLRLWREEEIAHAQELASVGDLNGTTLAVLSLKLYDKILSFKDPDGALVEEMYEIVQELKNQRPQCYLIIITNFLRKTGWGIYHSLLEI